MIRERAVYLGSANGFFKATCLYEDEEREIVFSTVQYSAKAGAQPQAQPIG